MKYLLLTCLICLAGSVYSQKHDPVKKKYSFGNFVVQTDTATVKGKPKVCLTVEKQNHIIYKMYHDTTSYFSDIDTIYISDKKSPDLIYCYHGEEYTTVALLTPDKTKVYRSIDLINVFDVQMHTNIRLAKDETIRKYVLKDIDGDGKKDIITNVISNGIYFKAVPGASDTLSYKVMENLIKNDPTGSEAKPVKHTKKKPPKK